MIQALITAAIAYPIISHMDKKRDGSIEGFAIVAFVAIPVLAIMLLTVGGGLLGLPSYLLLPLQLLFFLVPQLTCKFMFDYSWGVASAYGGIVFGAHVATSVLWLLVVGGNA